jgi:Ser/Thr protein kinase RdoA (MazF antagonist)
MESGRELVVQWRSADGDGLGAEPLLARLAAERAGVPVAPVLAAGEHDGVAYVVTERVPGEDLHTAIGSLDPTAAARVVRSLGRCLGRLHAAFPFDGAGRVAVAGGDLVVEDAAGPRRWLRQYVEEGIDRLPGSLAELGPRVRTFLDARIQGVPDDGPTALFPWDYRPGNAVLRDGRVAALLDWGDPLAASPELSVAKSEYLTADWYFQGDRLAATRAAFREGYREAAHLPAGHGERRPLYRVAGIVRSAVDSRGEVTRPRHPVVGEAEAVAFHRERLLALLD